MHIYLKLPNWLVQVPRVRVISCSAAELLGLWLPIFDSHTVVCKIDFQYRPLALLAKTQNLPIIAMLVFCYCLPAHDTVYICLANNLVDRARG